MSVLAVAPAFRVFSLWCAALKHHPFASPRMPSAPFQPIESKARHLQLQLAQAQLVLTAVNVLKIAFLYGRINAKPDLNETSSRKPWQH